MAIKCIDRKKLTKLSSDNLLTEIAVMKELHHEHVVKLKDFEVSYHNGFVVLHFNLIRLTLKYVWPYC